MPLDAKSVRLLGLRWIAIPGLILSYISLPRCALVLLGPVPDYGLTAGYFNLNIAYAYLLLGGYALLQAVWPRAARGTLLIWLQGTLFIRAVEAGLLWEFGMGFSPLVFSHVEWESLRLAVLRFWPYLLIYTGSAAAFHLVLVRTLAEARFDRGTRVTERIAMGLIVLLALRSAWVLAQERRRLPQGDFALASLLVNGWEYYTRTMAAGIRLSAGEREVLAGLDLDFSSPPQGVRPGDSTLVASRTIRPNLIVVYLEGFQAGIAGAEHSPHPGLTPQIDRHTAQWSLATDFYNGATPTINALISSQCGIVTEINNARMRVDRGFTANVTCLSDYLRVAGYYQVFMGGARSGFSGKRQFLQSHGFDEVWGWEKWRNNPDYRERRHDWGLHDTDLAREALLAVHRLQRRRAASGTPFHLALLTVNTHPPGYLAPDCPLYQAGKTLLNAFHCTDYAVGLLLDGLQAGNILENTVIVLVGDHPTFPTPENRIALEPILPSWYGKVFLAIHDPRRKLPHRIRQPGYSPDLAPTLLDLLGFGPDVPFLLGRSLARPGPAARRLIAPGFEIYRNAMAPPVPPLEAACPPRQRAKTVLSQAVTERPLTACERGKIFALQNRWLLGSTY